MYVNIEDFISDQYAEFLMNNTEDEMSEEQIAEYLEKEKKLIRDMGQELDDYLAEEKGNRKGGEYISLKSNEERGVVLGA